MYRYLVEHGSAWRRSSRESLTNHKKKLSFKSANGSIGGGPNPEMFADLFFKVTCARRDQATEILLVLDQVDCGVKISCAGCDRNQSWCGDCSPLIIYKMTIQVQPKSWTCHDCYNLLLQPHVTSQTFGEERASNLGIQVPISSPHQASITYQVGKAVFRDVLAFGWDPATRDDASNTVTWTWKVSRFANGSKFRPCMFGFGSMPAIGFQPRYVQIHPQSFNANASWEFQSNQEPKQLEWAVKVVFHTAVFQQKKYLPFHSVKTGPTVIREKLLNFA